MHRSRLALLLALFLLNPSKLLSCICGFSGTDVEALDRSEMVFTGTRVGSWTVLKEMEGLEFPVQRYRFSIDAVWEGTPVAEMEVVSSGSNCDFHFEEEARYLVFLEKTLGGSWVAYKCLPTRKLGPSESVEIPGLKATLVQSPPGSEQWWEPVARPARATYVFLALALRQPVGRLFPNERWTAGAGVISLWVAALSFVSGLATLAFRRVWAKRLLVSSLLLVALSFSLTYLHLRQHAWFSYLLN